MFSIAAAMDHGVDTFFKGNEVYVVANKETLATGSRVQKNLFKLDIRVPMQANIVRSERTLDEWHSGVRPHRP